VALEQRGQLTAPAQQVAPGDAIAQLAHRAARRETEDAGEEHPVFVALRLEQHDVGLREHRAVARHAQLQPRMHQGAKRLVERGREAALDQDAAAHRARLDRGARVHRHDRVDAQQQLRPVLQRDRRMQRLEEHAVHAVAPVHQHRRVHARNRRARFDGRRDRDVVPSGLAEADLAARTQVRRHHDQLVLQLPEVVGAAGNGEDLLQVAANGLVVEDAHRQRLGQAGQRLAQRKVARPLRRAPDRLGQQPGHLERPLRQLPIGGGEERLRHERVLPRLVLDDGAHELGGRQPVGQAGGDERPGADPDVDVEVVEVHAAQGLLECPEGADLVHGALGSATGQGEADPPAGRLPRSGHQRPVRRPAPPAPCDAAASWAAGASARGCASAPRRAW